MSGRQPQAEGRKEKILVEPYRVANLCQKNKKLSIAFGGTFQNTEPKHGFFRAFLFCNNPHYDSFGNTTSST